MAILAVIYEHGSRTFALGATPLVPADCFRWAVPTFVVLTGFFALRPRAPGRESRGYWREVARRLPRVGVPYVVWSGVYCVQHRAWTHTPRQILFADIAGYGWAGQYYFIILFQAAVVLPLLLGVCIRQIWLWLSFAALIGWCALVPNWLLGVNPMLVKVLDDRPIVFWLPYLLLGGYLSRHWGGRIRAALPAWAAWGVLAGSLILLATSWTAGGKPLWKAPYQWPLLVALSPIIFIALSTVAVAMPGRLGDGLAIAGEYSLGLFCLNPLLIDQLAKLTRHIHAAAGLDAVRPAVMPWLGTVIIASIAWIISSVLDRLGLRLLVR